MSIDPADIARRLDALEQLAAHCSSPEDREADRMLRKILRAVQSTLWLLNGAAKFAPLVGVLIGLWIYWNNLTDAFRAWMAR